ncbi:flavodoxin family protein [Acetivibrio cellulolyticus]|uniref:flavodoxin family protein n=1 Tax=Acetivibrio cellulolyticus TaxID=35830 RepID=UPI0001E2D895|nr:flavodoxin family protein [Acetivibrio cellulolyticus]
MIVILSDDKKQSLGNKIYESIRSSGMEAEYISTSGLNIKPCYSCGSCSTKTYRRCVIKDDMDAILRKWVRADKIIIVTPVVWGSYSLDTKKVLDRIAVVGDLHYYVHKGEIVKGIQSNMKMVVVGVKERCCKEESEAFNSLVHENINIMNICGNAFVADPNSETAAIMEEVCG